MKDEIDIFLNRLTSDFESIKNQAERYYNSDSSVRNDGAAQIFKREWIASESYGLLLFPPIEIELFDRFFENTGIEIPNVYKHFLIQMNGCFIYDFELFGLLKTNLLDRSTLQQHSLETANLLWKTSYNVKKELLYIGGRAYSDEENLGYFLNEFEIFSIRENGEILKSWTNFSQFLNDEIKLVELTMLNERNNR